jgi:hypothetical protein
MWILVDALDLNETLTQNYFNNFVLSDLKKNGQNLGRQKHPIGLVVHIDNSGSHNEQRVVGKMGLNHITRLGHQPYSPDSSPRDI